MANKKNKLCKSCGTLIWDVTVNHGTGLCKKCWSLNRRHTNETKLKLRASANKRWQNQEERDKQSERQIKRLSNPENHPNWKGGITPLSKQERSKQIHVRFRKKILDRDKVCVRCGDSSRLEVDHIKPFAFYPELRLVESNARILCHSCHKKTPTYARQTL